jgi:hypothetical protein
LLISFNSDEINEELLKIYIFKFEARLADPTLCVNVLSKLSKNVKEQENFAKILSLSGTYLIEKIEAKAVTKKDVHILMTAMCSQQCFNTSFLNQNIPIKITEAATKYLIDEGVEGLSLRELSSLIWVYGIVDPPLVLWSKLVYQLELYTSLADFNLEKDMRNIVSFARIAKTLVEQPDAANSYA